MTEAAIPQRWIDGEACQLPDLPAHVLFRLQAQRDPDALAIQQWDTRLSYRQAADAATALARRLRSAGARPAARVGVCMRRTPWLPVSELAVLMSGGAFLPLDPDQPEQRVRTIAADAGVEIALVDSTGEKLLSGAVERLVRADLPHSEPEGLPPLDESGPACMDSVAYIMHTSGSTGRPKGVMVSHRNLVAHVSAITQHLGDLPGSRLAAFAAIGFDVSVFEFFSALTCGAAVQVVPEAERADADLLQVFLQEHRSSHVFLPPVLLPLLDPGCLSDLRALIVGGEACDPHQVARWAVPGRRRFYNWYGPTEATVAVVGTELSGQWDKPLPIGRPLPGSSIYILDENMAICPPGVAGELVIGGPQVALGYTDDPEGAAERFVPDLFSGSSAPGRAPMLYRTGDLAEWDDAGVIWFRGRVDRQLKIYGRRVEPGEIEAVLSSHEGVTQAVVDVSGATIRAYVTPADAPTSEELREYCSAWLPRQMVPASVIALPRIPVTVNAKVDFGALRRLYADRPGGSSTAREPETDTQHAVARLWSTLFDVKRPLLDDDFFAAGGDSLSAMRLASGLRHATGRELSIEDVFDGRTLGGIAARLDSADGDTRAVPSGSAPALSAAQRRLWFVEQFAPGVPLYNIVLAEQISGRLDVTALERAFEYVTIRQSALRWRLLPGDGVPTVVVADPERVTIPVVDLSGIAAEAREQAVSRLLDDEAHTAITVTGGSLWRAKLLSLGDDEHVLVITVHHIVFDGWSQAILYRDLGQAYRQVLADGHLPDDGVAPRVTFADYTAWTRRQAERAGARDLAWWREHLDAAPTVLDLPRDRPRPEVLRFAGDSRASEIDADVAQEAIKLAAGEGTTVSVVLLAAFGVFLRRLTGSRDLVLGTPVVDRGHTEFESLIGFFVRTLPLRLTVDDHATFISQVRQCAEELAVARQHADVPLERIVEALGSDRDVTRNPLFQVMFNVYSFAKAHLDLGAAAVRPRQAAVPGSHVDLTVYVIVDGSSMRLEAAYNRDLYDGARIDALLKSYAHLLGELIRDPLRPTEAASARPDSSRLPDWTAPLPDDVPAVPGLLEQVWAIARGRPESAAIEEDGRTLCYQEILRGSESVRAALDAGGVTLHDVVAVVATRTAMFPPVLLGVLSTGARWVILDCELPRAALDRRLDALGPRMVIWCGQEPVPSHLGSRFPVIDAAAVPEVAGGAPERAAGIAASQRGYLSYTSGTTGEPKAVRVRETPLVHFLNWYRAAFGFGPGDRFALLSAVAHDPVLREVFTPLTCGATLVIPAAGLLMDPSGLVAWLAEQRISVAHLSPPLLRMMTAGSRQTRVLDSLRLVAMAGDQLTGDDVARLRALAPNARVLNCYGTTETPQVQAFHEIRTARPEPGETAPPTLASMPVPVGTGIDGAQLLVMSACGRPAGVGELGEVVIRSRYLSDGYLDPALTAERYAPLAGAGDGPVFRTGDLGRYTPQGEVILAGRLDDQVKIRGFRVELGEVEAVLNAHAAVERAAVRVWESHGATGLHAYVTSAGPVLAEADVLRHARSLLPSHAVPSSVTVLSTLPLTSTGKVDRRQLPAPQNAIHVNGGTDDMPDGDLEQVIQAVWREVLGLPRIGTHQKFFEIGGHSMAIIEVQVRLARALGRPVSVVDLFRFPTIRGLADHLANGDMTEGLEASTPGLARRRQLAGRLQPRRPRRMATDDEEG